MSVQVNDNINLGSAGEIIPAYRKWWSIGGRLHKRLSPRNDIRENVSL